MKYKRIDECVVDAVQLSFDKFREVEEWLTDEALDFAWYPEYLSITADRIIKVYLGEYIVKDGSSLLVYTENDFEHTYEVGK